MGDDESKTAEERRTHARYPADSLAVDYASGENFLFAYLQDISEMGIFIRSDAPLPIGTEIRLRFHLNDDDAPLMIEGEVVWVNPYRTSGNNLNPGMGVRFNNLTRERREQIVSLVRTVAYLRKEDH